MSAVPTEPPVELPLEVEAFLTHLVVEKGRSPLTISAYRRDLRRYVAFLAARGTTYPEASATDVDEFAARLRADGLASSSQARVLVSVRTSYRYLAAEGRIGHDPTTDTESPRRAQALPKAIPEADVMRLLDSIGEGEDPHDALVLRDRAMLELLYGTGARVSEVCGLGFGDLDLDGALLRVLGKRSRERIVPLVPVVVRVLREYLDAGRPVLVRATGATRDDADAVFLGRRGHRLNRQAAWEVIRKRGSAAGLDPDVLSPHVLRHSCATHLLDHGADIRTVQELLGHASISTTQIYTRVATERLVAAYRAAHPRAAASPAPAGQRDRVRCGALGTRNSS